MATGPTTLRALGSPACSLGNVKVVNFHDADTLQLSSLCLVSKDSKSNKIIK